MPAMLKPNQLVMQHSPTWLKPKNNCITHSIRAETNELDILKPMGRAHTTEENGKWGETKQRSENQVAFNSVLGPS
jgi:hypothetical protein